MSDIENRPDNQELHDLMQMYSRIGDGAAANVCHELGAMREAINIILDYLPQCTSRDNPDVQWVIQMLSVHQLRYLSEIN